MNYDETKAQHESNHGFYAEVTRRNIIPMLFLYYSYVMSMLFWWNGPDRISISIRGVKSGMMFVVWIQRLFSWKSNYFIEKAFTWVPFSCLHCKILWLHVAWLFVEVLHGGNGVLSFNCIKLQNFRCFQEIMPQSHILCNLVSFRLQNNALWVKLTPLTPWIEENWLSLRTEEKGFKIWKYLHKSTWFQYFCLFIACRTQNDSRKAQYRTKRLPEPKYTRLARIDENSNKIREI